MKWIEWIAPVENRVPAFRNKDGSILLIVLIVSSLMVMLGLAAIKTSSIELQISGNDRQYKVAFYAAESGIEVGRAVLHALKTEDDGTWDNLLVGNDLVGQNEGVATLDQVIAGAGGGQAGPASFTLAVQDNDDLDGSDQVDTDNTVILTSTGNFMRARVTIEAAVRYTGESGKFSQEHYDTRSSGEAAGEADAATNQIRFESGDGS